MAGRYSEEDNWQRIGRVEQEVAALQTDVQYIRGAIDRLVGEMRQPFPWGPIVSLVGTAILVLGGFATLITKPIDDLARYNREQIEANQKVAIETRAEFNRLAGKLERLERQLDEVDTLGSRRWNEDKPQ